MKAKQTHTREKAQLSLKAGEREGRAAPRSSMPRRRGDELGADLPADPYREKKKPASPAVCPDCRAVYQRGRWVWGQAPDKAVAHVCPACLRIRERQPAGYVYLGGSFPAEHKEELLRLLRNEEPASAAVHHADRRR